MEVSLEQGSGERQRKVGVVCCTCGFALCMICYREWPRRESTKCNVSSSLEGLARERCSVSWFALGLAAVQWATFRMQPTACSLQPGRGRRHWPQAWKLNILNMGLPVIRTARMFAPWAYVQSQDWCLPWPNLRRRRNPKHAKLASQAAAIRGLPGLQDQVDAL